MSTPAILLASRSPGKLRELVPLFEASGFSVTDLVRIGLEPSDEEDDIERFETFEENALAKARYFYEVSGGIPTVADDSGLEVHALGGSPGVRSKRWSGRADLDGQRLDDANNARLLAALESSDDRSARYVCAAAFVSRSDEIVVRGITEGEITREPRGTGGFGYDPYFQSSDLGRTFGEASREEKERVSHRGRAFHALLDQLSASR